MFNIYIYMSGTTSSKKPSTGTNKASTATKSSTKTSSSAEATGAAKIAAGSKAYTSIGAEQISLSDIYSGTAAGVERAKKGDDLISSFITGAGLETQSSGSQVTISQLGQLARNYTSESDQDRSEFHQAAGSSSNVQLPPAFKEFQAALGAMTGTDEGGGGIGYNATGLTASKQDALKLGKLISKLGSQNLQLSELTADVNKYQDSAGDLTETTRTEGIGYMAPQDMTVMNSLTSTGSQMSALVDYESNQTEQATKKVAANMTWVKTYPQGSSGPPQWVLKPTAKQTGTSASDIQTISVDPNDNLGVNLGIYAKWYLGEFGEKDLAYYDAYKQEQQDLLSGTAIGNETQGLVESAGAYNTLLGQGSEDIWSDPAGDKTLGLSSGPQAKLGTTANVELGMLASDAGALAVQGNPSLSSITNPAGITPLAKGTQYGAIASAQGGNQAGWENQRVQLNAPWAVGGYGDTGGYYAEAAASPGAFASAIGAPESITKGVADGTNPAQIELKHLVDIEGPQNPSGSATYLGGLLKYAEAMKGGWNTLITKGLTSAQAQKASDDFNDPSPDVVATAAIDSPSNAVTDALKGQFKTPINKDQPLEIAQTEETAWAGITQILTAAVNDLNANKSSEAALATAGQAATTKMLNTFDDGGAKYFETADVANLTTRQTDLTNRAVDVWDYVGQKMNALSKAKVGDIGKSMEKQRKSDIHTADVNIAVESVEEAAALASVAVTFGFSLIGAGLAAGAIVKTTVKEHKQESALTASMQNVVDAFPQFYSIAKKWYPYISPPPRQSPQQQQQQQQQPAIPTSIDIPNVASLREDLGYAPAASSSASASTASSTSAPDLISLADTGVAAIAPSVAVAPSVTPTQSQNAIYTSLAQSLAASGSSKIPMAQTAAPAAGPTSSDISETESIYKKFLSGSGAERSTDF